MLQHVTIRDFALIEYVDITFTQGMNVLLGETGAGKSIIIDALASALGGRLSADSIRQGAKKCILEASFSNIDASVAQACTLADLDVFDNTVVFRRELTIQGTSRLFINDTPVSSTTARSIATLLMDFHGQHDTHSLLAVARHREVLDEYGALDELVDSMRDAWHEYTEALMHERALQQKAMHADAERARLQFIYDELVTIDPKDDEDATLAAELRKAESFETIVSAATHARDLLYSGTTSAYDSIQQARLDLITLAEFDDTLSAFIDDLDQALTTCKEAASSMATMASSDMYDAAKLEHMRQRQQLLQRLVRKYGSLQEAIAKKLATEQEITELESMDAALRTIAETVRTAHKKAQAIATSISKKRKARIAPLVQAVQKQLHALGMPNAILDIVAQDAQLGPHGIDDIEFLLSSNKGEKPRPMQKVASGGELSRIMLSLKTAMAHTMARSTMVFDEIDTGISGAIARKVGDTMKQLATQHQILCITHLAQIASLAENYISVEKSSSDNGTTVHASNITTDRAVDEIAKLLSGNTVTQANLHSARELMLGK